ncbi:sulfotransferase family 2 domain-containing protein [Alteraurantiacibacter palmitatis]|uniref:Sulfotransferase family 2 domain-containing protein n=1 Tax=Alteraurantiacibacter palmitatis TaxID=2054628 RepID=A0ABV7E5J6_9SPHN
MIVSDTYHFAFIHIPKCAGTTVRAALEQFDERQDEITRGLTAHPSRPFTYAPAPGVAFADFHHLTLGQLQRWFPAELARIEASRSFAVIRDPHERLISSLSQRLKQFHGLAVEDLPPARFAGALDETLAQLGDLLDARDDLPFDFVHFQPQADYILLDGTRVVEQLFGMNQMAQFQAAIAAHFAPHDITIAPFHLIRENTSKSHRYKALHRLMTANEGATRTAKAILPKSLKKRLRGALYQERGDALRDLAQSPTVRGFVAQHYARDLELWAQTQEGAGHG